jgi:hypothetical protein
LRIAGTHALLSKCGGGDNSGSDEGGNKTHG